MESIIGKIIMDEATLEDFQRLNLRTATIVSAEIVPNSKIIKFIFDLGN